MCSPDNHFMWNVPLNRPGCAWNHRLPEPHSMFKCGGDRTSMVQQLGHPSPHSSIPEGSGEGVEAGPTRQNIYKKAGRVVLVSLGFNFCFRRASGQEHRQLRGPPVKLP